MISASDWANYHKVINDASDTFNQSIIIWKRSLGGIDRFGEDNKGERFEEIPLFFLADYNRNRVWPITSYTETGEIDKQSEVIMFNMDYLRKLGYVNANDNFIYQPDTDRFIHKGITWKCSGITHLSQAGNKDLLLQAVLQKDIIANTDPIT
jgi:hypothetical protein